jgi:hypothetical protein
VSASGEENRRAAPKREDGVKAEALRSTGLRVPAEPAERRQRDRAERQTVKTEVALPDRSRCGDSGSDSAGAGESRNAGCIPRARAHDRARGARPLGSLRVVRDAEECRKEEHRDDRGSGAPRRERDSPLIGGSGTP